MKEYKIDIPVLLIFFCRDKQFSQVFEEVKKARPSKLYLYQDGARLGNKKDEEGIKKCREICSDEQIDWNCEVHRLYQTKNFGCDPSEFIAQKWMFEIEEMGIILEDDDVPSQSFFPFAKELLVKYKDDTRINMICAMNNNGVTEDIKESYLFTKKGSIWGWASWKRVLDTWDGEYKWLDSKDDLEIIKSQLSQKKYEEFIKTAKKHKASGREHYESINAAAMYLGKRYNIVPKYNMMKNIGIDEVSTHSVNDIRLLPKRSQRLLYMKTYEIEFPLVHPKNIKLNKNFEKSFETTYIQDVFMRLESLLKTLKYQGVSAILRKIKAKLLR